MTGDWDRALGALNKLPGTIRAAAERATKKNAMIARDAIKRNIRDQVFDWEPLQAATIARKGSSKMLIDKGDLLNSITFKIVTPYAAFVGVLRTATRRDGNAPLVNIARIHEFGFMGYVTNPNTGTVYFLRIPPRSFIMPTINEIRDELYGNWTIEIRAEVVKSVS